MIVAHVGLLCAAIGQDSECPPAELVVFVPLDDRGRDPLVLFCDEAAETVVIESLGDGALVYDVHGLVLEGVEGLDRASVGIGDQGEPAAQVIGVVGVLRKVVGDAGHAAAFVIHSDDVAVESAGILDALGEAGEAVVDEVGVYGFGVSNARLAGETVVEI